jgi:AcrR family transcriptional regulator
MAAVVADVGYERATIRAVVARARISSTTYYDFFADKEDCFLATADASRERLVDAVVVACSGPPGGRSRFEVGLQGLLDFCAQEPAKAHVCLVELGAGGPAAQARRHELGTQRSDLADSALSELSGQPQARLASTLIVGGVLHLVADRIANDQTESLPELAPELLRLVVPAFGRD